MFRKNKDAEEALDNDLLDEPAESPEGIQAGPPQSSGAGLGGEDEDENDSEDKEEKNDNEEDEKPDEAPRQQSKKVTVKQERSSDKESDDEDTDTDDLFEPEGELAIDVYQTDSHIVIQSAIAGVKPDEIDISVENDIVTIRGMRKNPEQNEDKQYFHEECFWGPFSRQVFLPEEIDTQNVQASLKDGILTLRMPRIAGEKTKKIKLGKK